jgi:hypothetical protein
MPDESIACPKRNALMEEWFILQGREYVAKRDASKWFEGCVFHFPAF